MRYFGEFGGQFMPEIIMPALKELDQAYKKAKRDKRFKDRLRSLLSTYAGRPTPLYYARRLSEKYKAKIYLKREDLLHTGSHKLNNTLGQVLLGLAMGKKRVIAETGAGQHGVAVATAAALFGLTCAVYMGEEDIRRQRPNVDRMSLLGAEVIPVTTGSRTLKDAINEALRDWITNLNTTYYALGSVVGPYPYPEMVREFQKVIGRETKKQILKKEGRMPDYIIACVGGGSNAAGIFAPFIDSEVKLVGVEAGGKGVDTDKHSATLVKGRPGFLHGSRTYLLQDKWGQVSGTHSVSAGLDYPGVGPEHSFWKRSGKVKYTAMEDRSVLDMFSELSRMEGIIPALESAHALAYLKKMRSIQGKVIVINLSGRGDKDMDIVMRIKEGQL